MDTLGAKNKGVAQSTRTSGPAQPVQGVTQILKNDTLPYAVLVVSRHPEIVTEIEDMLLTNGETVFTATTITQAWENIRIGRVGLVILDSRQPAAEELLLLSTTRALQASAGIPFLFLKDKAARLPSLRVDCEDHIRDAWLDMPCAPQDLCAAVTRLFQQREYSRRLKSQGASPSSGRLAATSAAASNLQAGVSSSFQGIFNGRLGELDVPKLLGMLAPMGLTGVLTIKNEKRKGQIFLVNGAVWHATVATIKGPDALSVLFRIRQGKFTFDVVEPPNERTIQSNTMGLLLEGLREMDESKARMDLAKKASLGSGKGTEAKAQ